LGLLIRCGSEEQWGRRRRGVEGLGTGPRKDQKILDSSIVDAEIREEKRLEGLEGLEARLAKFDAIFGDHTDRLARRIRDVSWLWRHGCGFCQGQYIVAGLGWGARMSPGYRGGCTTRILLSN
jgi:hypothetical protein